MIIWIAPVLGFLRSALPYALLFLRSIPDFFAPKPTPVTVAYTPPFTGGQCSVAYWVQVRLRSNEGSSFYVWTTGTQSENPEQLSPTTSTAIQGAIKSISSVLQSNGATVTIVGVSNSVSFFITNYNQGNNGIPEIYRVRRVDGGSDNCGDVPNPTPPPSVADDGLFNPTNPHIADDNGTLNPAAIVLVPAAPLVLINNFGAALAAALAAARAAADALAGIRLLADGLELLKDLFKKIAEDLDEKEKLKPKNRAIVRQTYGRILGDGALDFFPNNNTKFQSIQLDVVITNIPIGYGRYFGSLSPSRYRFRELGYIAFYSVNQGILSTHSIQFKRTSYQIPELAVGFIYHLGLDEQIKGYAFGTFSIEGT